MGTLSVPLCLRLVLVLLLHVPWSLSSSLPPTIPSSHHLCLPNQRDALLQFKNTISLFHHCDSKTDFWKKSIDCCSWERVTCDNLTGHVIGINLTQSCLEGPLLANNTLFQLHNLQWLDLSYNQLYGSLLEENTSSLFHNFHRLQRLNLAHNCFNGTISSGVFSQLVSLTHLDLSYNEFSGGLVPHQISLLSSLVSLDLSVSNLRFDAQDFVMLATNLTKLTSLVLDSVDMSDVAVTSFLNFPPSLETLSLRSCDLHGEFPPQVFQLPNLKHLDLAWNENLTGYLPKTNMSSALELLDLSFCVFRGLIPASLGNLTQIISIDLSENQFEGQIPDVFGNFTKLTSLTFSSCNLSGPLPMSLFNLVEVTHLNLSHNHLDGPLPNNVSELQLLEELLLSHNSISGGVPSWLFTLPSLEESDLGYNKLAGPIGQIQKPSYVRLVDLSSNNLSGVVKSDLLSKLTSLASLNLSNNSLLSLSTDGNNDVNYSFPELRYVFFSGCNVKQFPSFFRTSQLTYLDLSNNNISGGISKWEAQGWEELYSLNLSYNSLTNLDQIPGLASLRFLDIRSNLLQGPLLSTRFNHPLPLSFNVFLISENKLTGNIPSSICNWSSLAVLDLSRNSFSGAIPECLGNSSDSLEFMNLQMNNFYGKIPDSFANKNYLTHLYLNDNQFEGFIPPSLANSTSLQLLNLGHKLNDRFPHWLASLSSLQVLILRFNRFHGSLPRSIASYNFSALRILDLSGNEFTGPLPTKLFPNMRAMSDAKDIPSYDMSYSSATEPEYYYQISVDVITKSVELELKKTVAAIFISIDLSNNQFIGQIPEEVGQLISLNMLNFSRNNFTGPIPTSLGNLVALESLDLSSNNLSGRIPSEMTNLTFLEVLKLSENDFVGPIPHGKQFDTFDNASYSGNLGLCDFPLSKQCINHGVAEPPASSVVEHEGSTLPFFWKVVMMGYGSGVVLGVSLGYIVFTTGRPWCFVQMVERDWQPKFTKWMRRTRPKRN